MLNMKLKLLREKFKITQTKIAKDIGITQQAYANYEAGIREPDAIMLKKLANYFNVTVDYLLDNFDKESPNEKKITDEDIKFALFNGDKEITDEMYEDVKRFAAFVKDKYHKGKKENNNGDSKTL